jgi:hypothetical protein
MPIELAISLIGLTFFAVCVMAAEILLQARRQS